MNRNGSSLDRMFEIKGHITMEENSPSNIISNGDTTGGVTIRKTPLNREDLRPVQLDWEKISVRALWFQTGRMVLITSQMINGKDVIEEGEGTPDWWNDSPQYT